MEIFSRASFGKLAVGLGVLVVLIVAVAAGIGAGQFGTAWLWSRIGGVMSYSSVETTSDRLKEFDQRYEIVDIEWRILDDGEDGKYVRVTYKYTVRNLTSEDLTMNSWRAIIPTFVDAEGFAIAEAATGVAYIVPANGEYTHTGIEHIDADLWEQVVDLRLVGA